MGWWAAHACYSGGNRNAQLLPNVGHEAPMQLHLPVFM